MTTKKRTKFRIDEDGFLVSNLEGHYPLKRYLERKLKADSGRQARRINKVMLKNQELRESSSFMDELRSLE
jgi:hypothetical protein